jgi:hypothetical protein
MGVLQLLRSQNGRNRPSRTHGNHVGADFLFGSNRPHALPGRPMNGRFIDN